MYRFLLSPRWMSFIGFVIVLALACLALANWQLDRLDERHARNDVVRTNIDQEPVPARELLEPRTPMADENLWRNVTLTGRYDVTEQRLLRKRPYQGQVGFHVVVPLVGADGIAMWVNRGWIPNADSATEQPDVPDLPTGTVDATVRLRQPAAGTARADDLPVGQIDRIAVEDLSTALGRPFYLPYGELVAEEPLTAPAPAPVPPPNIEEGPHLSYALQWVCFSVIGFVGFVVFARKERERLETVDA